MFPNQFAHSLGAFLFFALLLLPFCLKTFYCEFDSIHENDYFDQLYGRSLVHVDDGMSFELDCRITSSGFNKLKKTSSIFRSFVFCLFDRFHSLKIEPKVTRLISFPMNLAIETNQLTKSTNWFSHGELAINQNEYASAKRRIVARVTVFANKSLRLNCSGH